MNKQEYYTPMARVVTLTQRNVICSSAGTEHLSGSDFDWSGSSASTEPLTGNDYNW